MLNLLNKKKKILNRLNNLNQKLSKDRMLMLMIYSNKIIRLNIDLIRYQKSTRNSIIKNQKNPNNNYLNLKTF
jgi:hypothetical protein